MKIILTNHARRRLRERLKCHRIKISKIVQKAWKGKGDSLKKHLREGLINHKDSRGGEIVKYYQGYIFLFVIEYNIKADEYLPTLITIYNPKEWTELKEKT